MAMKIRQQTLDDRRPFASDISLCSVFVFSYIYTVEPRYNDLRYNDIPGITINMSSKSYSKIYWTEPRYNHLRYNDEFLAHRA